MADTNTVVHIGENSPEQVAYRLMEAIAKVESKTLYVPSERSSGVMAADRKWILDTYAECMKAIRDPYGR